MQCLRFLWVGLLLFSGQNCSNKLNHPKVNLPSKFPNVQIDKQKSDELGPCEPSIFINPLNTNNLVAGAILDRVYYSIDGGQTWTKNKLTSSMGVWGDPVIYADKNGHFYYAHLSDPSGLNFGDPSILDRIVIQKSIDGGKSWSDGSFSGNHHPKDQDKQWLTSDPQTGHLYLTWTEFDAYKSNRKKDKSRILFSKSTDRGQSWSNAIAINQLEGDCKDDDMTTEGAVPAIGPNGEVYVAWAFNEKIYFDRSMDGGATWLAKDILVSDQPGGWTFEIPGVNRTNGLPVTCSDNSNGPHRGNVYVNWSDQRNGSDDTDVFLAISKDGGTTWSDPIRINDDAPGKHNFLTWMCVDPTSGFIFVVFYDRRAYENNETDVYLAYSMDGGQTFVNQKISETPFTPRSSIFFGDYNNITAYNGKVRPIWTRYDNFRLSIWTAIIDFE